jgi:hypothetical protein
MYGSGIKDNHIKQTSNGAASVRTPTVIQVTRFLTKPLLLFFSHVDRKHLQSKSR